MILSVGCKSNPDTKDSDAEDLIKEQPATANRAAVDQSEVDALVEAAKRSLEAQKWETAIEAYDRAIQIDPNNWELYADRAIAESKKPNFIAAIASMRKAMELGGEREWKAWFNLGNIYQNRGLYNESIEAYRVALGFQDKPHLDTLINLSSGYIFLSRFDEATATLDYIIEISPREPRAFHNLALILHMQRKFPEAEKAYAEVHDLAPDFAQSYFNRGDVLATLKRYEEAVASFERYVELEPNGPYVRRAKNLIDLYRGKM